MENETQGKTVKTEHFSNLVAVAYADGFLDKEEQNFLSERANEYGLSDEEVQALMDKAEDLKFVVPLNSEEREDQLADIVYIAMIDGHVHEKEYELCLSIAKKLDFQKEDLDQVIELTRKLWQGMS
jgi:tellurite resistance protein